MPASLTLPLAYAHAAVIGCVGDGVRRELAAKPRLRLRALASRAPLQQSGDDERACLRRPFAEPSLEWAEKGSEKVG